MTYWIAQATYHKMTRSGPLPEEQRKKCEARLQQLMLEELYRGQEVVVKKEEEF
jgi:hypothetical protein